jgi:hypothetical protein
LAMGATLRKDTARNKKGPHSTGAHRHQDKDKQGIIRENDCANNIQPERMP